MKSVLKLALLLSAVGTLSPAPAVAAASFGDCVSPVGITLPVSLGSDAVANEWLTTVETAQLEYGDYLQCLLDYWTEQEKQLTDRENEALIEEMRASIDAFKRLAVDWNDLYGKYQGERVKSTGADGR